MSKVKWALAGLVIAAVAGFIAYRTFRRPEAPDLTVSSEANEETADKGDFFTRLKERETQLLSKGGMPSVTRHDKSLKILPSSGNPLEFKDCYDCGPEGDVEHYLIERLEKPAAVLVYRQYYEGDDEVLVTSDGFKHELPSWPVFSKDGNAFVVVSTSEAFNWNGLQVWEKSGGHYLKKFEYEPKGYEQFSLIGWKDGNRISLNLSNRDAKGREQCQGAELVKKSSWKLERAKKASEGFCPLEPTWLPNFLRD